MRSMLITHHKFFSAAVLHAQKVMACHAQRHGGAPVPFVRNVRGGRTPVARRKQACKPAHCYACTTE